VSRGVLYALAAYVLWGVFPIYFKQVQTVPALEVLAHRMLWSLAFVALLLALLRGRGWARALWARRATLAPFVPSALLVSVNWLIFIWAVNAGHIVDASLGYFINPLITVLMAALLLRERLRPAHWLAVSLAALGVAWLTWSAGRLPWIGLALAVSFALYGLLKKRAPLGALEGLAVETALLAPLALAWLAWLAWHGKSAFGAAIAAGEPALVGWLLLAGPVTAVPLLLFSAGAQRIPLATLGLLQYVGPTLQLIIGVWLYHEPFDRDKLLGYATIWVALAIFSVDGLLQWRAARRARPEAS
jgi:chloramphenicol-sensitive protein RarD